MPITSVLLLRVPSLHLATIWQKFRTSNDCSNQLVHMGIFLVTQIISLVSRYGNQVTLNGQCKILGLDSLFGLICHLPDMHAMHPCMHTHRVIHTHIHTHATHTHTYYTRRYTHMCAHMHTHIHTRTNTH